MTLKELKKRHESGVKHLKSVKAQIKAQLARECDMRGCHESLAFRTKTVTRCEAHMKKSVVSKTTHKAKTIPKAVQRKLNREKKKRYYERHGIKFNKNIRNRKVTEISPKTKGVLYDGQHLLYENYKEPLKPIEKSKGYGYYGTVAITSDTKYIQCHLCGNLFENLGGHLRKHKIAASDYKERFGLSLGTSLVSEPVREAMQKNAVKLFDGKLPDHLVEYNRKVQAGEIKHKAHGRGMSLEKRNKLGLCPDQVLTKITDLAKELGHTPSSDEFRKHYSGRYMGSIVFQHGSYLKAVKKAGLRSAKEEKEYTTEELITELQDFHKKHKRIPMTSDFNRGLLPSRNTYFHRFGSLNNARVEAGLNAVLPMPFGQIVEMSPDQYLEYKKDKAIA